MISVLAPTPRPRLDLTIRCGLEFVYEAPLPTPAIFVVKAQSTPEQAIEEERFSLVPQLETTEFCDDHGNIVHRVVLPPGSTTIRLDSLVRRFESSGEYRRDR